jgi:hypothetical protein
MDNFEKTKKKKVMLINEESFSIYDIHAGI